MISYIPALIMFLITVGVVSLFIVPVTAFPMKNKLVNFYWAGFWLFLALIAAISGGSNTLMLLRVDAMDTSMNMLAGILASFVLFVVFGWFRLSGKALWLGYLRVKARFFTQA